MTGRWRTIEEFPAYEISDAAFCRSKRRPGHLLKPTIRDGYPAYILHKDNKAKRRFAHRLTAIAFIPNPDNLPVVAHIDGDPFNNHVSNLRWSSHKQNSADREAHGRTMRGQDHHMSHLTSDQVIAIRAAYAEYQITCAELANQYGVHESTIAKIVNHTSWTHL